MKRTRPLPFKCTAVVSDVDGTMVTDDKTLTPRAQAAVEQLRASGIKIVGVSKDFDLLARADRDIRITLAERATVARSQPYYLDITHPLANKGTALSEIAKLLGVSLEQTAVIGDVSNDVAMFKRSGLSIAMGNASPDVQQAADLVTDGNEEEGFANAIERFILGGHQANDRLEVAGAGGAP
jgi:hypothetical protein